MDFSMNVYERTTTPQIKGVIDQIIELATLRGDSPSVHLAIQQINAEIMLLTMHQALMVSPECKKRAELTIDYWRGELDRMTG